MFRGEERWKILTSGVLFFGMNANRLLLNFNLGST